MVEDKAKVVYFERENGAGASGFGNKEGYKFFPKESDEVELDLEPESEED